MRRRHVALASSLGACTAVALILALGLTAESAATRRYVIDQHLGSLLFAFGFTPVGTGRPARTSSHTPADLRIVDAWQCALLDSDARQSPQDQVNN
jgi:hypothetical protein